MNRTTLHVLLSIITISATSTAVAQENGWWQSYSQAPITQQSTTSDTKDAPTPSGNFDSPTPDNQQVKQQPSSSSVDVRPAKSPLVQTILSRLKSPDINVRIATSQGMIYGKGITDKYVYTEVAKALEFSIHNPKKSSDNETAWHALALASSGDPTYLPVLENLVALKITRHAERARDELLRNSQSGGPFTNLASSARKAILISETQSQSCQFISQETCNTSRGEAKCIAYHQAQAGKVGANSILLINSSTTPTTSTTTLIPIGNSLVAVGGTSRKTTLIANYYTCNL